MREQVHAARYWSQDPDGRIRCDVCPRCCALKDRQRGLCFVRQRLGSTLVLTAYGRSSGFAVDPIEKKPLYHFYPGSSVLSFGTAGCNLTCKFCQNWNLSTSRQMETMAAHATPEAIASAAKDNDCVSVAFTYNEPTVFLEYAMDTADACHERGVRTVAVTAGYINSQPRRDFYGKIDAANVDLKFFSDASYRAFSGARLAPVLETLEYLAKETRVWLEVTTLVIPGLNDSDQELGALVDWVVEHLGAHVPLHFSAFHPSHRMLDVARTPFATLQRGRNLALRAGLQHVYTGNVLDIEGGTTFCPGCGEKLLVRTGFRVGQVRIDSQGQCLRCGIPLAGHFDPLGGGAP